MLKNLPPNESFGVFFLDYWDIVAEDKVKAVLQYFNQVWLLNQRMRTHNKEEKASTIKLTAQEVTGTT